MAKNKQQKQPEPKEPQQASKLAQLQQQEPKKAKAKKVTIPLKSDRTGEFDSDWDRLSRSGQYDMSLLKKVMMQLIENEEPLDEKYRNHTLQGQYADHEECHIKGDWLLIYRIGKKDVIFIRTGTHSELFDKKVNKTSKKLR